MTDGIMNYFAKIGIDASEFLNGLSKSQAGMLAFYRDVSVTMNMTMQIFDRVTSVVKQFGQTANELRDLSYTTGITTDKLQRMQYAAILSGTSFYTVSGGINRLTLSMEEATSGTEDYVDAFNELGVNPTGKSPDQVFEEVAGALLNMEDLTQRNAIANTLYGKSWKELLPYMEGYLENRAEIEKYRGMDAQNLKDLEKANVEWGKLSNNLTIATGNLLGWASASQDAANKYNPIAMLMSGDKTTVDTSINKLITETAPQTPLLAKGGESGTATSAAIDAVTDAMKAYKSALDDVADAQERLNDVNKEYTRDLQTLDSRDVQGFINLRMRHNWAVEDQSAAISSKGAGVTTAAGEVGRASAAAAGITITGPIYLNGDKSFEKMIQEQRIRAGVR